MMRALQLVGNEKLTCDRVPYARPVTDSIVSTHNGGLLSVWKIDGRSHECVADEDLYIWLHSLNSVVKGVGSENVSFYTRLHHRPVTEYQAGQFSNPFCREFDRKYRASLGDSPPFITEIILSVFWRDVKEATVGLFAINEEGEREQEKAVEALQEINRTIGQSLKRYGAEILSAYDFNGNAYFAPMEAIARAVNGEFNRIPVTGSYFSEYLMFNRPFFSFWGEIGQLHIASGDKYFGIVEVKDFDDSHTEPGQLNALFELDFEYFITHSFSVIAVRTALELLRRKGNKLESAKDKGVNQIKAIEQAQEALLSREFCYGQLHSTIMVLGNSKAEVRERLSKTKSMLLDCGIVPHIVDTALEAAFWAQLPGNLSDRPRPLPVTSQNFLCLSPLHNLMTGKPTGNPWGPAITVFKTVSGSPLYFSFHSTRKDRDATDDRALGNTLIVGKSGEGKTVLLSMLLAQAQKINPVVVALDRDRGMQAGILAMGGRYFALRLGEPTGMAPFQMEPTPENMVFLKMLARSMAASSGDVITHHDEIDLDAGLATMMFEIEKEYRSVSVLVQNLPSPASGDRPSLSARLQRWCRGYEYGWVFDNDADLIDLSSHRMFGFDFTAFLNHPVIRGPALAYIIHRMNELMNGQPFIFAMDEAWQAIEDERLSAYVKEKEKVIRKQNGIVIASTQEPNDLIKSKIGDTLVSLAAKIIALPNQKASREDYVNGLKFTEQQFHTLRGIPEGSRLALIVDGDSAAIAKTGLGEEFDDEILVFSGTPERALKAEEIVKRGGDLTPEYLEFVRGV